MELPHRGQFGHFLPITVRWGDMDALGHVNNTLYFRYSEHGRVDYLESCDGGNPSEPSKGNGPILAEQNCRFLEQLRYPAEVEVASRIKRVGNSSIDFEQLLFARGEDQVFAVLEARIVWFDFEQQRSCRVPDHVRRRIADIEPEEVIGL